MGIVRFFEKVRRKAIISGFDAMRTLGKTPPPKSVVWECTLGCNMRCDHCGAYQERGKRTELSTKEILRIVKALSDYGVRWFFVTGGEPMRRPDLLQVLGRAKELGMKTGVSTNGYFICEKNAKKIAEVTESNQVSVDGIGQTHDRFRRKPGAFKRAMNAIRLMKRYGCRQVCLTSTITPHNFNELEQLYELAKKNADLWRVCTVMPIGRAARDDSLHLSQEQLTELLDFVAEKMRGDFPILVGENLGYAGDYYDKRIHKHDFFFCGAGITSCCIGVDGRVRGCPELPSTREFIAGDLRKSPFREIWESGFDAYRNRKYRKLPGECRECPDLDLCLGGCGVMRLRGMHCTKKRLSR